MPKRGRLVALVISYGLAAQALPAWAQQSPAASAQETTEVLSLAGLPAPVRAQLLGNRPGQMSDRGGPFNEGDVGMPGVPSRRFVRALVGKGVAVVDVEQGGRSTYVEALEFREVGGGWKLVGRRESNTPPPQ